MSNVFSSLLVNGPGHVGVRICFDERCGSGCENGIDEQCGASGANGSADECCATVYALLVSGAGHAVFAAGLHVRAFVLLFAGVVEFAAAGAAFVVEHVAVEPYVLVVVLHAADVE